MTNHQPEDAPRNTKVKILTTLLGLVAIALLGYYLFQNRMVFSSLGNVTVLQITLIIGLETIVVILGSVVNYSMVRRFGYRVTFLDSVLLQYINNFLNKILPTIGGGAAFRAVFLKKKYQFPYSQFVATLGGFYLINFIATSLIGLCCMAWIYLQYGETNWVIISAFLLLIIPSLLIVFFTPKIPGGNNRISNALRRATEGWNILKKDKGFISFYAVVIIVQLLLSSAEMLIAFNAIGVHTGYIQTLYLSSLGIILSFLNFTPDGIGIREAVYVFSSSVVQIPQANLVLASLVLRALSIVTSLSIGGVGYLVFLKQIKKIEETQGSKSDLSASIELPRNTDPPSLEMN